MTAGPLATSFIEKTCLHFYVLPERRQMSRRNGGGDFDSLSLSDIFNQITDERERTARPRPLSERERGWCTKVERGQINLGGGSSNTMR